MRPHPRIPVRSMPMTKRAVGRVHRVHIHDQIKTAILVLCGGAIIPGNKTCYIIFVVELYTYTIHCVSKKHPRRF